MGDQNKYSQKDDECFDRLMKFSDIRAASPDDASTQIVDTELTYSESDNQAFEQLMDESVLANRSRSGPDGSSFLVDGYSDSDNSRFDDLASAISDLNIPPPDVCDQSDQRTIEYSLADKQVFSRLMSEGFGVDDGEAGKLEINELSEDTSHIKIIDFDKEQSRQKSRSRQGSNPIKIRYFD